MRLARLEWKALGRGKGEERRRLARRRTVAALKGEIARCHEKEVDLVLFRPNVFACGIHILEEGSICFDKHDFTL